MQMVLKDRFLPIFLISLMASSILFNVSSFSSPENTTRLYIDPSSVMDKELVAGETFTVDVKIDNVENLYAFEFKLKYDPELLKATSIQTSFLNSPTWIGKKSMDNEAGVAWVAITSWYPAGPKTGSGTLATITFEVKDKGDTDLDLYGTKLADYDIKRISHDVEDGYFSNKQKPKLPKVTLSGFMPIVNAQSCVDYDTDEYGTENLDYCPYPDLDCDDENPLTNPGSTEICDRKDNDCDSLIDEPDICCAGDVDHDIDETNYYNVDIFDLAKVGKAYGSTSGNSRWDPYCDLNDDGIINIFDLAKVGKNYGNSCWACVTVTIHVYDGLGPIFDDYVELWCDPQDMCDSGFTDVDGNWETCLEEQELEYYAKTWSRDGQRVADRFFTVPEETYIEIYAP